MTYAIVINLDYEHHPPELCSELWNVIKFGMLKAGFTSDGRRFISGLTERQACEKARRVIDDIEDHLEYHRRHLYRFMREFYGYDTAATTNLLVPDDARKEVRLGVLT